MLMKLLTCLLAILLSCTVQAQILISEAVSSNGQYEDEDGDTPDWLELYNPGPDINLHGYSLTDELTEPRKWVLPDITVPANSYQLFWASDKDRRESLHAYPLLQKGSVCRYLSPDASLPGEWTTIDYNDADWDIGTTDIGSTQALNVTTETGRNVKSLFLRQEFVVDDPTTITQMVVDLDFESGIIAYLNGEEIYRFNMSGNTSPQSSSVWVSPVLSLNARPLKRVVLTGDEAGLVAGRNVLAVQVHSANERGSKLYASTFLTAFTTNPPPTSLPVPPELDILAPAPHLNFKISAGGETLYLFDPEGEMVSQLSVEGLATDQSTGYSVGVSQQLFYGKGSPGYANPLTGKPRALTDRPQFSLPEGQYGGPVILSIAGSEPSQIIRYTLDGSVPVDSSALYEEALTLEENTVLRARAFADDALPSPVATATYLIGTSHDIDVVSLVADPEGLFDPVVGIYSFGDHYTNNNPYFGANFWEDRELPATLSIFPEDGSETFQQDLGAKIFGNYSRANAQRSFALHARGKYGDKDMDYSFFANRPHDEYSALVLRNGGNDWMRTLLRDAFLTSLMEGTSIDLAAHRPVATYLNGQYWGLYNLREKINEDFLGQRHNIDPDLIDIVEKSGVVVEGSNLEYKALSAYIRDNDLSTEDNYQYVADRIDIENYILYHVAQIYWGNRDWPGNNVKMWRPRTEGGKWHWIMYDTDLSAGYDNRTSATTNSLRNALVAGGTQWPNPDWSTLHLRNLVENESFRHRFINQFADEMNTRFVPGRVIDHLGDISSRIASEIPFTFERWNRPNGWTFWLSKTRTYFNQRPPRMKQFILDEWNLPAYHEVTVRVTDTLEGYVELNSLELHDTVWSGDYFESVPIRVKAVAKDGYQFSHWELGSTLEANELTVDVVAPHTFLPVFTEKVVGVADQRADRSVTLLTDLTVGPNPTLGLAHCSFNLLRSTRVSAQVLDVHGGVRVNVIDATLPAGEQRLPVYLGNLSAGSYVLRLEVAGKAIKTVPIFKQ
ncbi:CotH kinase family protein [Lewinella sp. 4G2]|uniref:CotH kinase family protein n=1 Tax=Lewinella sp. 4G2 TaxID=1803372 RepID=UPI0007B4D12A|nr:CotH kinase family protein [Lewinella sp. 4G2]OAV44952.1 hypothetical protein A3850_010805 [Lewinella sp. 4G2]